MYEDAHLESHYEDRYPTDEYDEPGDLYISDEPDEYDEYDDEDDSDEEAYRETKQAEYDDLWPSLPEMPLP